MSRRFSSSERLASLMGALCVSSVMFYAYLIQADGHRARVICASLYALSFIAFWVTSWKFEHAEKG